MNEKSSWTGLTETEILQRLGSDLSAGLKEEEASRRLGQFGYNELVVQKGRSPFLILLQQFTSTMVLILIIAAIISGILADYKDMVVILSIVVLNGLLGFHQEYRAEEAMEALRKYAVPTVKVLRDGQWKEVPSQELVPGDIFLLEAGNLIPADGRLLETHNLRIKESSLTGESEPVEKFAGVLSAPEKLPLAERSNMVYRGTIVTYGRGVGVVTETGNATEFGRIAEMIQEAGTEPTPLQRRMDQLGRSLAFIAIALVVLIFLLGVMRGQDIKLMFLTSITLAVAAVPEGLPAVVTIALSLGAQRMLKQNALIRKLTAVETLGSVTVICSDKTGTLTQDRMSVKVIDLIRERIEVNQKVKLRPDQQDLTLLLTGSALCNDAVLQTDGEPDAAKAVGDPTEAALLRVAAKFGLQKKDLERMLPRIDEIPFSSERKRMSTLHQLQRGSMDDLVFTAVNNFVKTHNASFIVFVKGAADGLLQISKYFWGKNGPEPITNSWIEECHKKNNELAQNGMRILGVAIRSVETQMTDVNTIENDLVFLGMVAMIDPPRPEAAEAVGMCMDAGIRPIMITGDHPLTAKYIANQLGIVPHQVVITGSDLDSASVEILKAKINETPVFARVTPSHKFKIIEVLKDQRNIVAMTGDGVNDAPALKKADIGVAMGITGTDVAKEASDMILLDDNFASIVAAVKEGRVIYDNIRKFVRYILTTNSSELWVMTLSMFFGMPLALLPLQILLINLVTDGLPALALGVEPAERNVMRRPPHKSDESILARGLGWHVLWVGLAMGVLAIATGYLYWISNNPRWQTMIFTTVTFTQMAHVLAIRSERDPLWYVGFISNKWLLSAV
ncbi:MAG TPA: cation-translocating P-type ATPase, partial [Acidobacteriota bacterium]|nr:cation-translocating P-type ATPase [Acidobacteriota bacterium]